MADVETLKAEVAKHKASSRENLKKVMAITKEKKDVETQLQMHVTAVQQLQAQLQAVPTLQPQPGVASVAA